MGVKFEDMDILDALGKIMELHTKHYKDDFDLDKELLAKLAVSEHTEDRRVLWMSRPCGTYTLRERDVYLQDSHENKIWNFYHEQTNDPILAYAPEPERNPGREGDRGYLPTGLWHSCGTDKTSDLPDHTGNGAI